MWKHVIIGTVRNDCLHSTVYMFLVWITAEENWYCHSGGGSESFLFDGANIENIQMKLYNAHSMCPTTLRSYWKTLISSIRFFPSTVLCENIKFIFSVPVFNFCLFYHLRWFFEFHFHIIFFLVLHHLSNIYFSESTSFISKRLSSYVWIVVFDCVFVSFQTIEINFLINISTKIFIRGVNNNRVSAQIEYLCCAVDKTNSSESKFNRSVNSTRPKHTLPD